MTKEGAYVALSTDCYRVYMNQSKPLNHSASRICTKEIARRVRITPEVSENSGVQSVHAHNE